MRPNKIGLSKNHVYHASWLWVIFLFHLSVFLSVSRAEKPKTSILCFAAINLTFNGIGNSAEKATKMKIQLPDSKIIPGLEPPGILFTTNHCIVRIWKANQYVFYCSQHTAQAYAVRFLTDI